MSDFVELRQYLEMRHNAMLADLAAEAINDFRVALSLLCGPGTYDPFDMNGSWREPFRAPFWRIQRGLR
jgi:hypothetical protein